MKNVFSRVTGKAIQGMKSGANRAMGITKYDSKSPRSQALKAAGMGAAMKKAATAKSAYQMRTGQKPFRPNLPNQKTFGVPGAK